MEGISSALQHHQRSVIEELEFFRSIRRPKRPPFQNNDLLGLQEEQQEKKNAALLCVRVAPLTTRVEHSVARPFGGTKHQKEEEHTNI